MKTDVVVIGGSLAGSACIRELERLGVEAVAFERDRFPRAKVCGGFLSPGAVACLDHLQVLDEVRNAGAVIVERARLRAGRVEVELPFKRPGLGVSRSRLDAILANRPQIRNGCAVKGARRGTNGFDVETSLESIECTVLIDASGKLGRFTTKKSTDEFGVQYHEPGTRGGVLDFWFFDDGYGGAVSVEDGRSNFCFLVKRQRVASLVVRPDCMVTGPIAYEAIPGGYIAIGDAAGMVDPFCGEGMRHALDSGIAAARIVARGLRAGKTYDEMRCEYGWEWHRRWSRQRALASWIRAAIARPRVFEVGLRCTPAWFLDWLWA